MGLENIRKRIVEDAGAEADALVARANEHAAKLADEARARNDERRRGALEEAEDTLRQHHDEQVTAARAANRLKLLGRRAELLNDVFDAAVERFVGDRKGDYRTWLSARLTSVAGEKGTIVPAAEDRGPLGELLEGLKGADGLQLGKESLPLRGGFVLQGEKADLDLSLDTQLAEAREELLPDFADRAFGDLPAPRPGAGGRIGT